MKTLKIGHLTFEVKNENWLSIKTDNGMLFHSVSFKDSGYWLDENEVFIQNRIRIQGLEIEETIMPLSTGNYIVVLHKDDDNRIDAISLQLIIEENAIDDILSEPIRKKFNNEDED